MEFRTLIGSLYSNDARVRLDSQMTAAHADGWEFVTLHIDANGTQGVALMRRTPAAIEPAPAAIEPAPVVIDPAP